ncbi:hypothetical protein BC943DRAFT_326696 [Umbelopsis sp. AD052]|nr:hypothetical protein BC943DRAFT_326696 [Umbelopsis sp. AD052]
MDAYLEQPFASVVISLCRYSVVRLNLKPTLTHTIPVKTKKISTDRNLVETLNLKEIYQVLSSTYRRITHF